jgi:acid stress chaperone HdeB
MHKILVGVVIVSLLGGPVAAEDKMVVDMSKMTCRELTKLGFQDFAGITMWLSGYYNASVRNTVIDLDQFAQAAKTVKDFCQTSPQVTVMSAAEQRSASRCRGSVSGNVIRCSAPWAACLRRSTKPDQTNGIGCRDIVRGYNRNEFSWGLQLRVAGRVQLTAACSSPTLKV